MTVSLLMTGLVACAVRAPDKDVYLVSDRKETHGKFVTVPNTATPVTLSDKEYVRKVSCGDMAYRYSLVASDAEKKGKRLGLKVEWHDVDE